MFFYNLSKAFNLHCVGFSFFCLSIALANLQVDGAVYNIPMMSLQCHAQVTCIPFVAQKLPLCIAYFLMELAPGKVQWAKFSSRANKTSSAE